jgi:hypothetical protein
MLPAGEYTGKIRLSNHFGHAPAKPGVSAYHPIWKKGRK